MINFYLYLKKFFKLKKENFRIILKLLYYFLLSEFINFELNNCL